MDRVISEVRKVLLADAELRQHLLQLSSPDTVVCKPELVETCEFGLAVWAQSPDPDAGLLERHLAAVCQAGHQKQLASARRGIALLLAMIEFDDAAALPMAHYGQELASLMQQVSQAFGTLGLAPLPPLCLDDTALRNGHLAAVARALGRLVDGMDSACRALAAHSLRVSSRPTQV